VSEQILNGTSAQLGYTVPFMLVYAGKYGTIDTTKTKHNPEKANYTKHSKTKLAWFSRFLLHSARKRGGLILQRSRANTGAERISWVRSVFNGKTTSSWLATEHLLMTSLWRH